MYVRTNTAGLVSSETQFARKSRVQAKAGGRNCRQSRKLYVDDVAKPVELKYSNVIHAPNHVYYCDCMDDYLNTLDPK
jgi:hypothetical protein